MHLRRIQQPWVILGIDNPFVLRASPDRTIRQSPTHNGQVRPDYGLGWKKEGKCAEAIGAGDTGAGTELGHVGPWGEKIRKRENYMENMEIAGFTFFWYLDSFRNSPSHESFFSPGFRENRGTSTGGLHIRIQ